MSAPADGVIAGIGQTALGKHPGQTAFGLMTEAAKTALDDCGLSFDEVDGLLAAPVGTEGNFLMTAAMFAPYVGLQPDHVATVDLAGASGAAMVPAAAAAIAAGECQTVLCVGGSTLLSAPGSKDATQHMVEQGSADLFLEAPFGPSVPSLYALLAQRHMHEFGTTEAQMAAISVAFRQHAAANPLAYRREALSLDEALAAPYVSTPLKKFDCSIVSDGAYAFIVTSADRAADLKKPPVRLLGHGTSVPRGRTGDDLDLARAGAAAAGTAAFRRAGVTPVEIDVAELYDCFTIAVLLELEDLGFCPRGEAGAFVASGAIARGGSLPINTHGGLLSAGHTGLAGGMSHIVEAVHQLRDEGAARQVEGAEIALCHGNGGVCGVHCTIILGSEATS